MFIMWEAGETEMTAAVLARELLIFTLMLSTVFLAIVYKLNTLVSNSIVQPIDNMLQVIEQVKGDDFTPRVRVISNDEIGNTVNLASRIEELTKKAGWDILVGEETVASLAQPFPLEKVDPQPVKGYSKPVTVYRLL